MPALTLDALLRNLKKGTSGVLAPVYLLYGEEDVLKDEAIRALIDAALGPASAGARDFNLDSRYAADLSPESFNALVNTPPMLAERRAVVVRNVEQLGKRKTKLRDEVIRYLAAPNPTTLLVLVVAADEDPDAELVRGSTPVELKSLSAERIPRWMQHRAAGLELTLTPEAAGLLLAAVGSDLNTLSRELEKLAGLTGKGRPATPEDVTGLVGVRHGETIYDLVAAALERRASRAAQLVEPVLEQAGMSGVKIVSLLGTHLVGTALALAERDRGGAAAAAVANHLYAVRPYGLRSYKDEAARWVSWSAHWTAAELAGALRAALAADTALKTAGVTDDRGIVTQLVLGFAKMNREAA